MSGFHDALNEQIGSEFAASQQYIAIAVYYDVQTLPVLAAHFYRQALEERNHAMMIVQYLIDADARVTIPAVAAPQTAFDDERAPVALALEQEKHVTAQIAALVKIAHDESDYVGAQFLGWFLEEQREHVLPALRRRSRDHEQPVARRGLPRAGQRHRIRAVDECATGSGPGSLRLNARLQSRSASRRLAASVLPSRPASISRSTASTAWSQRSSTLAPAFVSSVRMTLPCPGSARRRT
jgi:bacterioferritin B